MRVFSFCSTLVATWSTIDYCIYHTLSHPASLCSQYVLGRWIAITSTRLQLSVDLPMDPDISELSSPFEANAPSSCYIFQGYFLVSSILPPAVPLLPISWPQLSFPECAKGVKKNLQHNTRMETITCWRNTIILKLMHRIICIVLQVIWRLPNSFLWVIVIILCWSIPDQWIHINKCLIWGRLLCGIKKSSYIMECLGIRHFLVTLLFWTVLPLNNS